MSQMTIDEFEGVFAGEQLAALAMERARLAASENWVEHAREAIVHLCQTRPAFTTDDVWDALDDVAVTSERRALGSLMRSVSREGWCVASDMYQASRRPERHRGPVRVWRSRAVGLSTPPE